MHEEFALQYERRWLERFGLNYYGCCEPLHLKLGLLRSVPRLRKVSMSPWPTWPAPPRRPGGLVLSIKPNPAILAGDVWRPEVAQQELRDLLRQASGCITEVIMKDVSTVRSRRSACGSGRVSPPRSPRKRPPRPPEAAYPPPATRPRVSRPVRPRRVAADPNMIGAPPMPGTILFGIDVETANENALGFTQHGLRLFEEPSAFR